MKTKSLLITLSLALASLTMGGCMGSSSSANATGGELTGVRGSAYSEPTPYGMVAVRKGSLQKANEDEQRAIESVYVTHPIDGTKMLDASQLNYRYEIYDYAAAALRKYRLNPEERDLNTDHAVDMGDVMISKDTAWIDDDGKIVRQTSHARSRVRGISSIPIS